MVSLRTDLGQPSCRPCRLPRPPLALAQGACLQDQERVQMALLIRVQLQASVLRCLATADPRRCAAAVSWAATWRSPRTSEVQRWARACSPASLAMHAEAQPWADARGHGYPVLLPPFLRWMKKLLSLIRQVAPLPWMHLYLPLLARQRALSACAPRRSSVAILRLLQLLLLHRCLQTTLMTYGRWHPQLHQLSLLTSRPARSLQHRLPHMLRKITRQPAPLLG